MLSAMYSSGQINGHLAPTLRGTKCIHHVCYAQSMDQDNLWIGQTVQTSDPSVAQQSSDGLGNRGITIQLQLTSLGTPNEVCK